MTMTLLEHCALTAPESPAERLRITTAAVRVSLRWFGIRKTLTPEQKSQAAESFGAEGTPSRFSRSTSLSGICHWFPENSASISPVSQRRRMRYDDTPQSFAAWPTRYKMCFAIGLYFTKF